MVSDTEVQDGGEVIGMMALETVKAEKGNES